MVDIDAGRVVSWNPVAGVQPPILDGEYDELVAPREERTRAGRRRCGARHHRLRDGAGRRLGGRPGRARGIRPARLLRALTYFRAAPTNFYGRPDRRPRRAGEHEHRRGDRGRRQRRRAGPAAAAGPGRERRPPCGAAPKRARDRQPERRGFTISGQEIRWQKWRFRYTLHPREGLVLHTVGYEDGGRVRPILYRAALSEMVVPYGDADQNWRWRSAFDVGEYGLGRLASSIEPEPTRRRTPAPRRHVCRRQRPSRPPWPAPWPSTSATAGCSGSTTTSYSEQNESRRARQLVVFFIATIGNYDYAHQLDLPPGRRARGGRRADRHHAGQRRQGDQGRRARRRAGGASGRGERRGAAPSALLQLPARLGRRRPEQLGARDEHQRGSAGPGQPVAERHAHGGNELASEREAPRGWTWPSARHWLVVNLRRETRWATTPATCWYPGPTPCPMWRRIPRAPARRFPRPPFLGDAVPRRRAARGGPYPNQSRGGDGLPRWSRTMSRWWTRTSWSGTRWASRTCPARGMAGDAGRHVGFRLIPAGFFSRNPALDVPACRTPAACP